MTNRMNFDKQYLMYVKYAARNSTEADHILSVTSTLTLKLEGPRKLPRHFNLEP